MKKEKNAVGVYPKSVPSDLCDLYIEYFNSIKNPTDSGVVAPATIDSEGNIKEVSKQWDHRISKEVCVPNNHHLSYKLHEVLNPLVLEYCKKHYAIQRTFNQSFYEDLHILKYEPNIGKYDFHSDADGPFIYNRMVSIIIYFNDVKEGGETEFEYIDVPPVKPKKGTVLMFPSGWTHQHRGNIPISNEKYIGVWWLRAVLNGETK